MEKHALKFYFILDVALKADCEINEEYQPESSSSESVKYSIKVFALLRDLLYF